MTNEKKESSNLKTIIWTIVWIVIIISSVFLVFFLMKVSLNTNTPVTVVSGQSMEPTYYEGDLLFIRGVSYNSIIPGDHLARNGSIVVYMRSFDGLLIVHRVTGVRYNYSGNEIYEFQTWGDNNAGPDGWQRQGSIVGVVVFRIPWIGWVSLVFTRYPIIGYSIIGAIIIILIITSFDNKEKKKPPENIDNNIESDIQCKVVKNQI